MNIVHCMIVIHVCVCVWVFETRCLNDILVYYMTNMRLHIQFLTLFEKHSKPLRTTNVLLHTDYSVFQCCLQEHRARLYPRPILLFAKISVVRLEYPICWWIIRLFATCSEQWHTHSIFLSFSHSWTLDSLPSTLVLSRTPDTFKMRQPM